MQPYLLHPAFVHFPIAFLVLGVLVDAAAVLRGAAELRRAASALLIIGSACLWIAVGLGLLAERTAPHVPAAWEVLADHEMLAYVTAGAFSAFTLLRLIVLRRRWRWLQLVLWLGAAAVLGATAYHGGELVFRFGMGVTAAQ